MPPGKRNRDDDGVATLGSTGTQDQRSKARLAPNVSSAKKTMMEVEVKQETEEDPQEPLAQHLSSPPSSSRIDPTVVKREDPIEQLEGPAGDVSELKAWVKTLLKENQGLKDDNQQLEEQKTKAEDELKEYKELSRVSHFVKKLFSSAILNVSGCKLVNGLEPRFFYPNPYVVALVEEGLIVEDIESSNDDPFSCRCSVEARVCEVKSFSEVLLAFKNGPNQNARVDDDSELFPSGSRMCLAVGKMSDRRPVVLGAYTPFHYLFGKELWDLDETKRVVQKYSAPTRDDESILESFTPLAIFSEVQLCPDQGGVIVSYTDSDGDLTFNDRKDAVNVTLSSVRSFKSKVNGYLPEVADHDAKAVKVEFDLDTLTYSIQTGSEGRRIDYFSYVEKEDGLDGEQEDE